jgi:hypothetical protein
MRLKTFLFLVAISVLMAAALVWPGGCEGHAQPPPFPPSDTNAPATNTLTLVTPPLNATIQCTVPGATNRFYLVLDSQTTPTNQVTFSNLIAGQKYTVLTTCLDTNGMESPPSGIISFILPPNTPFISADAGAVTIRSTVMQASTLQSSLDLMAWSPRAALAPGIVNTWTFPADQPREFFKITAP